MVFSVVQHLRNRSKATSNRSTANPDRIASDFSREDEPVPPELETKFPHNVRPTADQPSWRERSTKSNPHHSTNWSVLSGLFDRLKVNKNRRTKRRFFGNWTKRSHPKNTAVRPCNRNCRTGQILGQLEDTLLHCQDTEEWVERWIGTNTEGEHLNLAKVLLNDAERARFCELLVSGQIPSKSELRQRANDDTRHVEPHQQDTVCDEPPSITNKSTGKTLENHTENPLIADRGEFQLAPKWRPTTAGEFTFHSKRRKPVIEPRSLDMEKQETVQLPEGTNQLSGDVKSKTTAKKMRIIPSGNKSKPSSNSPRKLAPSQRASTFQTRSIFKSPAKKERDNTLRTTSIKPRNRVQIIGDGPFRSGDERSAIVTRGKGVLTTKNVKGSVPIQKQTRVQQSAMSSAQSICQRARTSSSLRSNPKKEDGDKMRATSNPTKRRIRSPSVNKPVQSQHFASNLSLPPPGTKTRGILRKLSDRKQWKQANMNNYKCIQLSNSALNYLLSRNRDLRDLNWMQSNSEDDFQQRPNIREHALLDVDELKSFTVSTERADRQKSIVKREDTSDSFVPSVESEFLHSSSDEETAYKKRPRPGLATGKKHRQSAQGEEQGETEAAPAVENDTSETIEPEETTAEGEADDVKYKDASTIIRFKRIRRVKKDRKRSKTRRSRSRSKRNRKSSSRNKRKNFHRRKPARRPSRRARWTRPVCGKSGDEKQTGERPAWINSTRNPALQFDSKRPIDSILWPHGRIAQVPIFPVAKRLSVKHSPVSVNRFFRNANQYVFKSPRKSRSYRTPSRQRISSRKASRSTSSRYKRATSRSNTEIARCKQSKRGCNNRVIKSRSNTTSRRKIPRLLFKIGRRRRPMTNTSNRQSVERSRMIEFVAYIAIIPSEIDELMQPFRASNLLRSYLQDIEHLLSKVQEDVEQAKDKNRNASSSESPHRETIPVEELSKSTEKSRKSFLAKIRDKILKRPTEEVPDTAKEQPSEMNNSRTALGTPPAPITLLTPRKKLFWQQVLKRCHDPRLSRLVGRLRRITDRRVYAIECQSECRFRLNEDTIYSVRGQPCLALRISGCKTEHILKALSMLRDHIPEVYRQLVFVGRFCSHGVRTYGRYFPTTGDFVRDLPARTPSRPSTSTLRRKIPVIEQARSFKIK